MPQQIFQAISSKNKIALSPDELKQRYFFGIPIIDSYGVEMSESTLMDIINIAITEMEGYLEVRLIKQMVVETLDYHVNDWHAWGFIPVTFPVLKVYKLTGRVGTVEKQIEFPIEWLSIKKSTEPFAPHRKVHVVPTVGAMSPNTIVYSGITPHLGWFSMDTIPDYWEIENSLDYLNWSDALFDS